MGHTTRTGDEGAEQGFATSARFMYEPEEAEVKRQLVLLQHATSRRTCQPATPPESPLLATLPAAPCAWPQRRPRRSRWMPLHPAPVSPPRLCQPTWCEAVPSWPARPRQPGQVPGRSASWKETVARLGVRRRSPLAGESRWPSQRSAWIMSAGALTLPASGVRRRGRSSGVPSPYVDIG